MFKRNSGSRNPSDPENDRPVQCILPCQEIRVDDALRMEAEDAGGEFPDVILR